MQICHDPKVEVVMEPTSAILIRYEIYSKQLKNMQENKNCETPRMVSSQILNNIKLRTK